MAVFRQGPRPEEKFTVVSNDLARDPSIPVEAKGMYLFMRSHRDGWHMTTDRIGQALGMSKNRAAKYITILIEAGYIIREQENVNGRFGSVEYVILSEPQRKNRDTVEASEDNSNVQVRPRRKKPHHGNPGNGNLDPIRRLIPNNTEKEEKEEGVQVGGDTYGEYAGGREETPSPGNLDGGETEDVDAALDDAFSALADTSTPPTELAHRDDLDPANPASWTTAEEHRCLDHRDTNAFDIGPCRQCANVRRWFEQRDTDRRNAAASAIDACNVCDERGLIEMTAPNGRPVLGKCDHTGASPQVDPAKFEDDRAPIPDAILDKIAKFRRGRITSHEGKGATRRPESPETGEQSASGGEPIPHDSDAADGHTEPERKTA